jgi:CRP/FNR family cyclic AMP-dependent transcriptional regulator
MPSAIAFGLPDLLGWLAAALTLMTFCCQNMVRLRCAALVANGAFIAYGITAQLWPVLVLHFVLVPINVWRLVQASRMRRTALERTGQRADRAQPSGVIAQERRGE